VTPHTETESPSARTTEQEVASGRAAPTPLVVLGNVILIVACSVAVVLGLVILAHQLA
jgi:hypothetical protein